MTKLKAIQSRNLKVGSVVGCHSDLDGNKLQKIKVTCIRVGQLGFDNIKAALSATCVESMYDTQDNTITLSVEVLPTALNDESPVGLEYDMYNFEGRFAEGSGATKVSFFNIDEAEAAQV